MSADKFIKELASSLEANKLRDFNFSFIEGPYPGNFTIIKRTTGDPLKSIPIATLSFNRDKELLFLEPNAIAAELCELFSKKEFEYQSTAAKPSGPIKVIKKDKDA